MSTRVVDGSLYMEMTRRLSRQDKRIAELEAVLGVYADSDNWCCSECADVPEQAGRCERRGHCMDMFSETGQMGQGWWLAVNSLTGKRRPVVVVVDDSAIAKDIPSLKESGERLQ